MENTNTTMKDSPTDASIFRRKIPEMSQNSSLSEKERLRNIRLEASDLVKTGSSDAAVAAARAAASHRRRSSLPFADRTAKVRFNRIETCITSTKPGPHKPLLPGTESEEDILKAIHSILKETDHPILVDLTLLTFQNRTNGPHSLTNDEMLLCIAMVEWQSKSVAKADRIGRGAMDILSFPTSGDRVEAASRLRACLMMSTSLMNRLTGELNLLEPEIRETVEEIADLVAKLVSDLDDTIRTAKEFLRGSDLIYSKWRDLLRRKGEFQLEHAKVSGPIYKLKMPENVTLYEDNSLTTSPYTFEGVLTFFWNSDTMTISSDTETITKVGFPYCTAKEQLEILRVLLQHGIDLVLSSNAHLTTAIEVFKEPILLTGFENIKTRVVGMKFEANFDPLLALDLKNTLCELAQRNCELMNCAENILETLEPLLKLSHHFDRFATQFMAGIKFEKRSCWLCCCRSEYVRFEELSSLLGRMPILDILLSIPMPTSFEMPANRGYVDEDDDLGDDALSVSSTIYRLIRNSEAELSGRFKGVF